MSALIEEGSKQEFKRAVLAALPGRPVFKQQSFVRSMWFPLLLLTGAVAIIMPMLAAMSGCLAIGMAAVWLLLAVEFYKIYRVERQNEEIWHNILTNEWKFRSGLL
jgi:hypothetical protein